MTTITFTQQFKSDLAVAMEVFPTLNLKGVRPKAVAGYLTAASINDDQAQEFIDGIGAGMIRRGLRQIAQRLDRQGRESEAAAFWSLRDDIDGGEQFHVEYADDAVEYDNVA